MQLLFFKQGLIAERKKLSRTSPRYVEICKRLAEIRKALSDEEKKAVAASKFVATTVSKAIADKTICGTKFDVVIFDEASMAYIPQIVFSASLASKHFICMGDYCQLPPIVQSDDKSILNADIFQYCGISRAVDIRKSHKWLCLLNTQYRMHPTIVAFTSSTMYNGLLKTAPLIDLERRSIVDAGPIEGAPIGLVDLSGMMSVCTKTADNSRVNPLSAFIAFSYALQAADIQEVGIITPYHAQSRLFHAMSRDAELSGLNLKRISCATVHQFQGSEKDVIIYDAVDCYRMPYPGKLLTSSGNNYANRLFNVALTRAKGKFICVTNAAYMNNKKLSQNLLFGKLLYQIKAGKDVHTGIEIMKNHKKNGALLRFYAPEAAESAFLEDLKLARWEIRIDIPNAPADMPYIERVADTLIAAKAKGIKVFIRAEKRALFL